MVVVMACAARRARRLSVLAAAAVPDDEQQGDSQERGGQYKEGGIELRFHAGMIAKVLSLWPVGPDVVDLLAVELVVDGGALAFEVLGELVEDAAGDPLFVAVEE